MDTMQIEVAVGRAQRGIAQYLEIMAEWPHVNVAESRAFQRKFNAFYRVRQRSADWYGVYYGCMQECKIVQPVPTFDDVLDHLWKSLGRCEASFASKLVATLDPTQPVWDAFVLKNTGVSRPSSTSRDRIAETKAAYRVIRSWYDRFLACDAGTKVIEVFNGQVGEHRKITDLKKVDFVLWQMRS